MMTHKRVSIPSFDITAYSNELLNSNPNFEFITPWDNPAKALEEFYLSNPLEIASNELFDSFEKLSQYCDLYYRQVCTSMINSFCSLNSPNHNKLFLSKIKSFVAVSSYEDISQAAKDSGISKATYDLKIIDLESTPSKKAVMLIEGLKRNEDIEEKHRVLKKVMLEEDLSCYDLHMTPKAFDSVIMNAFNYLKETTFAELANDRSVSDSTFFALLNKYHQLAGNTNELQIVRPICVEDKPNKPNKTGLKSFEQKQVPKTTTPEAEVEVTQTEVSNKPDELITNVVYDIPTSIEYPEVKVLNQEPLIEDLVENKSGGYSSANDESSNEEEFLGPLLGNIDSIEVDSGRNASFDPDGLNIEDEPEVPSIKADPVEVLSADTVDIADVLEEAEQADLDDDEFVNLVEQELNTQAKPEDSTSEAKTDEPTHQAEEITASEDQNDLDGDEFVNLVEQELNTQAKPEDSTPESKPDEPTHQPEETTTAEAQNDSDEEDFFYEKQGCMSKSDVEKFYICINLAGDIAKKLQANPEFKTYNNDYDEACQKELAKITYFLALLSSRKYGIAQHKSFCTIFEIPTNSKMMRKVKINTLASPKIPDGIIKAAKTHGIDTNIRSKEGFTPLDKNFIRSFKNSH